MTTNKKLQVFVSSTYIDLRDERQAAVEAILRAGHIPAGMELFASGDQSQMEVIRQWIDASDVFLLILGGRYGSVEPESGKSYIHLEYEYALERGKPVFSVVIDPNELEDRVRQRGSQVKESDYGAQLKVFTAQVKQRLVRDWSNPDQIKVAIFESLPVFAARGDIVGWVPGTEPVDTGLMAEQLARLTKENAELRSEVEDLSQHSTSDDVTYSGLSFGEMYELLDGHLIDATKTSWASVSAQLAEEIEAAEHYFNSLFGYHGDNITLLHLLWAIRLDGVDVGIARLAPEIIIYNLKQLVLFGMIRPDDLSMGGSNYLLTDEGRRFSIRLSLEGMRQIGAR